DAPILTNVLLNDNNATRNGGGLRNVNSKLTLINATVVNNGTQGISNSNSTPIVKNSIIWGHNQSIVNNPNSIPEIAYSLVEGSHGSSATWEGSFGTDEGNNLDADPKFVDSVNDD